MAGKTKGGFSMNYQKTAADLLLRTRGKTWDTAEPGDGEFARVHVHGSDRECYVKLADLDGRRDRINLYEKLGGSS